MLLPALLNVYATVVGLIVGSYLNVVIYRLPRGISTVLPASTCPACRTRIHPRDNLPVVSFLLLRGRCRHCRTKISWRYPCIETWTALAFLFSYLRFGLAWETLVAALLCCLLIALAMIDLEHYILPDRLTLPGIAVGLLGARWLSFTSLPAALLGAALGAGVLLAVTGIWYLVRREQGMGLGDVKMLAMIGAFLGVQGVVVSLFVATLTGAITGLSLVAIGKLERKSKLPFGFFLTLGGFVALFAGDELAARYLGYL